MIVLGARPLTAPLRRTSIFVEVASLQETHCIYCSTYFSGALGMIGPGVGAAPSMNCDWLGMPFVKTVTKAYPMGKP